MKKPLKKILISLGLIITGYCVIWISVPDYFQIGG